MNRKLFEHIETFVVFVGYPRSGHSIIGAILDAHPNLIISHELDALQYINAGYRRDQLYYLIVKRSREYAERPQRRGGYFYSVPGLWKGKFKQLNVLGDKHGESTTLRLQATPALIYGLRETFGCQIKFVHVTRNPFDNISTIFEKTKRDGRKLDLQESIAYYFSLCDTVLSVKTQIQYNELFELKHETFVESPREGLVALCRFLGVNAPQSYLDSVVPLVFPTVRKSRHEAPWNEDLISQVQGRMTGIPFLAGYEFDD